MKTVVATSMLLGILGMWGATDASADDVAGTVLCLELVDNGIVVVLQPEDEQLEAIIIWMLVDSLPPNPPPNPPESYPATMYEIAMAAVTGSRVTFVNVEPIAEGVFAATSETELIVDCDAGGNP